jgi:hypothetical protein
VPAIIFLLRETKLGVGAVGRCGRLVERSLQLHDVLFGLRE